MAAIANLLARITGDASPFKAAIAETNAATDSAGKKAEEASRKFEALGAKLTSLGGTLSATVTAPIIALAAGAIKTAADFDSLQRGLAATMKSAGEASKEFERLREVARLPGLGLEEAVRGSIRLQALGTSASDARRIMREFGNAIAIVGGTKVDFGEVIRQLSQLGATGKVTKENLDPIIDRIPQVAAIIKEKFGSAALSDPAKAFERLGISSQQFIGMVTDALEQGARASGGAKAGFENLADAVKAAADRIGQVLLPTVQQTLPYLERMAEGVAGLAGAFQKLPEPVQNSVLVIGALVAVSGPVIAAIGRIMTAIRSLSAAYAATAGALAKAGISIAGGAAAASAAVGAAVGYVLTKLSETPTALANQKKAADASTASMNRLTEAYRDNLVQLGRLVPQTKNSFDLLDELYRIANRKGASAAPNVGKILEVAGIKKSYEDLAGEVKKLKDAEAQLVAAQRQGIDVGGNLAIVRKEIADAQKKLSDAMGQTTAKAGALENALNRLGVTALGDQIGRMIQYRAAVDEVAKAQAAGKASTQDLEAAQKALVGVWPGILPVFSQTQTETLRMATAFDFARERLFDLVSGAQAAASAIRNISFSQLAVVPDDPAQGALGRASTQASGKRNLELSREYYEAIAAAAKASGKQQSAAMKQVSTIVTDLSRGIADAIVNWENAGQVFANVGKSIASSLLRSLIENGLSKVAKSVAKLAGDFLGLGKVVSGVFGGAANASGTIFSAVGGGASSAAGGASSAISGVSSGIMGAVGAIGSVVSAVSGVISNFQLAKQEKTLNAIEESTRYVKIWTGEQSQNLLWCAQKTVEYLGYANATLDTIGQRILALHESITNGGIAVAGSGGSGGLVINVNVTFPLGTGTFTEGNAVGRTIGQALARELKLQGIR